MDATKCHVVLLNLSLNRITKLININPVAHQLQVLDLSRFVSRVACVGPNVTLCLFEGRNMIGGEKSNLTQLSLCVNLRELVLSQNQIEEVCSLLKFAELC